MHDASEPSTNLLRRATWADWTWIAVIALVVLIMDLGSKTLVVVYLRDAPPVDIIPGFLRLIYGENPGIAFGLFQDHGGLLHILTPLAFLILIAVVYKQFAEMHMDNFYRVVFGLLFGGALGNITNRLYNGYVIDFIDAYYGSYHWYTFNIADSALTTGEIVLVFKLLFWSHAREQSPSLAEEKTFSEEGD